MRHEYILSFLDSSENKEQDITESSIWHYLLTTLCRCKKVHTIYFAPVMFPYICSAN